MGSLAPSGILTMTLVATAGGLTPHQPWCTGHADPDDSNSGCLRTVEIAGVQVTLRQGSGPVELTVATGDQTPLTAAQARHLAAELVDASRVLQSADRP
jgi:hypothetical protein